MQYDGEILTEEVFYEKLFNEEPKPFSSIKLDLDVDNNIVLFERLIQIFHQGTIKFHGDEEKKVNLKNLSLCDFNYINKYFNSFGMEIKFKIGKLQELQQLENFIIGKNNDFIEDSILSIEDIINYKYRKTNNLDDLKFTILVDEDFYVIWFDYKTI